MWVYFTLCQQSTLKSQNWGGGGGGGGASCIGRFGQTDGRRKFELGIPKSQGATYIRGAAAYITDKTEVKIS